MRYEVRPISDRTPFTGVHEYTPFRATWADTLDLLDRELTALKAVDVVIEVDVTEGQIRLDGMLRADAKVDSPAVRLAFGSRHGPLTYATDRYVGRWRNTPADWQQNVRAIALGLEALRKVDRYGITRHGEQYAGWKQISSGPTAAGSSSGRAGALRVLSIHTGYDILATADEETIRTALRLARAKTHPDRNHGNRIPWDQVEQAAKVLGVLS